MIGRMVTNPRKFKNQKQRRKKGSGKGRICKPWPMFVKVMADAVITRAKGTMEAWVYDRRCPLSPEEFCRQMEALLPGFMEWIKETRKTQSPIDDLINRVFKMYYSGTSDRGTNHDPSTRAVAESGEHWHKKVPSNSHWWTLHEMVFHHSISSIPNWKEQL